MKLNNKGFTLVELLGVIIILVTIMLIAIPSITSTISRNKDKELEAKQELIIAETKLYVESHKNHEYPFLQGKCGYLTEDLYNEKIVSEENVLDSDGNLIEGCVYYDPDQNTYHFENPCNQYSCTA